MGCWTNIKRFLFLSAIITQTVMFAQYPSIYFKNRLYNLMILLFLPTLLAWIAVLSHYDEDEQLQKLWIVWGCYVSTILIPVVGLMYGRLRERLDSKEFFGPNVLMMITCGSPGIALLLLTTAKDTNQDDDNIDLFTYLCGNIVLELFDDLELLDMLLSQNEKFQLPTSLEITIIVFVCISLLFTTLEMAEKKYGYRGSIKNRKNAYASRLILQILVNIALFVIRLVVWLEHKHGASIFIAKNLITIVISITSILRLCFN